MTSYSLEYSAQHLAPHGRAGNADALHPSLRLGGRGDRDSRSPSDDGAAYPLYHKTENELDEDQNASLIAQTLNTDGTPKRPMNAFMIFARRRRPQVSAENQSLRTGEISKVLSKEWNAMELKDKQFYLDQAKQLKDIFNSKYPDYVYRRRPNNTRRKRGMGPGTNRPLDPLATGGEESGNAEFDDTSPIDEDLLADVMVTDLHFNYPRVPANTSPTYDMHSRAPSYSYPSSDNPYRAMHGRTPYPQSDRRRGSPEVPLESARLSQNMGSNHHYQQPYLQAHQSQPQSQASYALEHGAWDPSSGVPRGGHIRTTPVGWMNGQDRLLPGHVQDSSRIGGPPSTGHSSWGRATSPAPPAGVVSSTNYTFPTLNSPFYPNQPQVISDVTSSNSSVPSSTSNHYSSISNHDFHMYQQQTQHLSVQSMSSLSVPHSTSAPASSGEGTPSFWPGQNGGTLRESNNS